jgi:hypothetical protein
MKYADLKNKLIKIFRAFQKWLADIYSKFSPGFKGCKTCPTSENRSFVSESGEKRAKQNLIAMFRNSAKVDSYSDGKLIDECYEALDDSFDIDSEEAALFTTLLERFQKSIGLEITPNGMTVVDSILDEQWLEEVSSDDL